MVININFILSVIISSSAGQSGLSRQAATGSVFPVLGSVSYFSLCQCHRTSRNDPWDVLKKKKSFCPPALRLPSDGTVIRVYRVKLPSFWASVSEKTVDCLRITLNQCSLLSKFAWQLYFDFFNLIYPNDSWYAKVSRDWKNYSL